MTKRTRKNAPDIERVGPLQTRADRAQALETITRAFARSEGLERHMLRSLWQRPVFDPEHTRVVVADGRVVSAVVLGPRLIRFGPVTVPAMTVGPVATHDHYRKRNFASLAMEDATRYMEGRGILVAYLQGIPNFYHRFGYYPFLARCGVKFQRERARKEARVGRLRRMSKEDLPNVQRLYEKATENRIASAVRDDTVWNWLIGPGAKTWLFSSPKVILDQRGRFCGYVTIAHGNECGFREVIVKQDEESCRVALGAIVREAKRREAKEISFWRLPWDDPLAVFLRQHVDCEFAIRTGSTGGPLMLIVNFPALMQKLEPLFTKRWTETGTHRAGTRFTLTTESGAVGFNLTKNAVRTGGPGAGSRVRVPRRWLSGLLTGYYSVEEIAPRKGVVIPPEVKPALDILFPKGWPFVYQGDDY